MTGKTIGSRSTRWVMACALTASVLLGAALVPAAQARSVRQPSLASPAHGGSYTVWSLPVQCINPLTQAGLLNNWVVAQLMDYDNKGKLVANLATHWKLSNGGKRITFQLRKGVRFSNGDPFTATAAKWSIDQVLNPATKSPQNALISSVTKTKAVSKYVLQVDLKAPSRTILTGGLNIIVMLDPKAPPTCTSMVSAGPYKYTSVAPDLSSATVVVNKYHTWATSWQNNKKGVPYITTVHAKAIQSSTTAVSDALSGGIDYLFNVESTQLTRFQGNPNFVIHNSYPPAIWYWEFNTAHKPFDTLAGRKAWAELIDRTAIIKAAFGGLAKPSYSVVPPSQGDHDPKADSLTPHYNLADATRLIQQNHLTGPYQLVVLGDPQSQTIAQVIQASAAQAGMKIDIVTKGFSDWLAAVGAGNFDATMISFGVGPDPDAMYTIFDPSQCCGKGYAWNNYLSPKVHALLEKGREASTLKKAKPYYYQFQELYAKQAVSMGIVIPSVPIVIRNTIKGWHENFTKLTVAWQDMYIKTTK